MKRYLIFCGDTYYPAGGWDDLVDSKDNLEEAKSMVEQGIADYNPIFPTEGSKREDWIRYHWAHIVDSEDMEIVWRAE